MHDWKNSPFFNKLCDAFAKIEKHDIKVSDINISHDYMKRIINNPGIRPYFEHGPLNILGGGAPGNSDKSGILLGTLWGAKLNVVRGYRKFQVLGEKGFENGYNDPSLGRLKENVYDVFSNFLIKTLINIFLIRVTDGI